MTRGALRALLALMLGCYGAACGGSSTTPTPAPSTTTWSLTGTVTSSAGGFINGALVAVLDGPDAGKQTTTDAGGRYSFAGLRQAGFSVRVSANGYVAVTRGITLTSHTVSDVQLAVQPVAALVFEGDLRLTPRPDGGFDLSATGVNTGDGCAATIAGEHDDHRLERHNADLPVESASRDGHATRRAVSVQFRPHDAKRGGRPRRRRDLRHALYVRDRRLPVSPSAQSFIGADAQVTARPRGN